MGHDCSGPYELLMQAMTDSSKSFCRCLRETATVQYILHTKAQKWSAARLFAAVSALPLRSLPSSRYLAISPLRRSFHTTPLHRRHCTPMLSFRRARRIRSFFGPALRIRPFSPPPPLPISLRPRAATAPFFAPSLPLSARHTCRAVLTFVFFLHAFHVLPSSY